LINLRIFSSLTGISSPARCSTIKCKSRQIIDLRQVSTAAKVLKNDGVPHLKIIAFHIPSSKLQTPLYIIIILLIIFQREIPMDTAQAAPTPPTPVTSATSPVISMGMPHTASPKTWPGRPSHVPPTLPTTGCHAHARVSMLSATSCPSSPPIAGNPPQADDQRLRDIVAQARQQSFGWDRPKQMTLIHNIPTFIAINLDLCRTPETS